MKIVEKKVVQAFLTGLMKFEPKKRAEGRTTRNDVLQSPAGISRADIRRGLRDSRNTVVDWATTLIRDSLRPIFLIGDSSRPSLCEQMRILFGFGFPFPFFFFTSSHRFVGT